MLNTAPLPPLPEPRAKTVSARPCSECARTGHHAPTCPLGCDHCGQPHGAEHLPGCDHEEVS